MNACKLHSVYCFYIILVQDIDCSTVRLGYFPFFAATFLTISHFHHSAKKENINQTSIYSYTAQS